MARTKNYDTPEDSELMRLKFRRPRDVLLSVVGEFTMRASTRITELAKKQSMESKNVELLDIKSHIRLADIAHSLLKVSPYDPETMGCRGLQRYITPKFVLSVLHDIDSENIFIFVHLIDDTYSRNDCFEFLCGLCFT